MAACVTICVTFILTRRTRRQTHTRAYKNKTRCFKIGSHILPVQSLSRCSSLFFAFLHLALPVWVSHTVFRFSFISCHQLIGRSHHCLTYFLFFFHIIFVSSRPVICTSSCATSTRNDPVRRFTP